MITARTRVQYARPGQPLIGKPDLSELPKKELDEASSWQSVGTRVPVDAYGGANAPLALERETSL